MTRVMHVNEFNNFLFLELFLFNYNDNKAYMIFFLHEIFF
jgi:hypothetical protein